MSWTSRRVGDRKRGRGKKIRGNILFGVIISRLCSAVKRNISLRSPSHHNATMPSSRFEPSSIKNKIKREEVSRKQKKSKGQEKLQRRLAQAKLEADDPALKKVRTSHSPFHLPSLTHLVQKRKAENVPRTLDNTREFDASILTAEPTASTSEPTASTSASASAAPPQDESAADISSDPFASYFSGSADTDPSLPQKVLITTSKKSTRVTYEFCEELVSVFPGSELIRRKKGKGYEMGRIAGWAADREYTHLMVVNEDMKKPSELVMELGFSY